MRNEIRRVQSTYLMLILFSTLSTSLIWGINALFLLDAGLSPSEAFSVNATFTLGMLLFEIPTGVVADTWGRRPSILLGAATLLLSTIAYMLMWTWSGPFIGWVLCSIVLGLGYTFWTGAVEAWLVDALDAAGYQGSLEEMLGKGRMVAGIAMICGVLAGGYIAEFSSLGVPFILRALFLACAFAVAMATLHDEGFEPQRDRTVGAAMREIVDASIDQGWNKLPVRWMMLTAPFSVGLIYYIFYALQPYLLELHGNPTQYSVAAFGAALFGLSEFLAGALVTHVRKLFRLRTQLLLALLAIWALTLLGLAWTSQLTVALILIPLSATSFALIMTVRSAYINGLVDSKQRATVLSFDSLLLSVGAVISQSGLGFVAEFTSYATSFAIAACILLGAVPFLLLARRERAESDFIGSFRSH